MPRKHVHVHPPLPPNNLHCSAAVAYMDTSTVAIMHGKLNSGNCSMHCDEVCWCQCTTHNRHATSVASRLSIQASRRHRNDAYTVIGHIKKLLIFLAESSPSGLLQFVPMVLAKGNSAPSLIFKCVQQQRCQPQYMSSGSGVVTLSLIPMKTIS